MFLLFLPSPVSSSAYSVEPCHSPSLHIFLLAANICYLYIHSRCFFAIKLSKLQQPINIKPYCDRMMFDANCCKHLIRWEWTPTYHVFTLIVLSFDNLQTYTCLYWILWRILIIFRSFALPSFVQMVSSGEFLNLPFSIFFSCFLSLSSSVFCNQLRNFCSLISWNLDIDERPISTA